MGSISGWSLAYEAYRGMSTIRDKMGHLGYASPGS
jgi:hypothetical protein